MSIADDLWQQVLGEMRKPIRERDAALLVVTADAFEEAGNESRARELRRRAAIVAGATGAWSWQQLAAAEVRVRDGIKRERELLAAYRPRWAGEGRFRRLRAA